ncbi:hypothetical protein LuPra_00679 [Luteitalea pratensis]|uniref:Outer membrane protein beta-barrel domain-containing protein n=1 Tax=Luteitalea pratensis TaxID=1855912 RepID=A0A143PGF5_LUTPR|nr:hypothetical protein [Luteitalea pratensis]AMY07506.1 hypothetical protein LuPra_00679 [Luteitalea pratensis]
MRVMAATIAVLCIFVPHETSAQTSTSAPPPPDAERERRQHLSVQVAAGPTWQGGATVMSAALGYAPASWLELLVNVERIHAPLQSTRYPSGYSMSRGGTMTFASGELRVAPLPGARVSPFVMAGVGWGVSRPNVNAEFPESVRNDLRVVYLGGGARVPLRLGFSLLGDARAMVALEGYDSVVGVWAVRGGIAWRF